MIQKMWQQVLQLEEESHKHVAKGDCSELLESVLRVRVNSILPTLEDPRELSFWRIIWQ